MILKNKVVLVTGAGSRAGVGFAIAKQMTLEGAKVIATDIKDPVESASAVRAMGCPCESMSLDVTDSRAVNECMDRLWDKYGGVDVLVNNAGVCLAVPLLDTTDDIWDKTIAVNLSGVYHCGTAWARRTVANGRRGKIVNISSYCVEYPSMNQTAYAASKGGVYMLSKNMALELAPYYINVNCVAPAGLSTNILAAGNIALNNMGHGNKVLDPSAMNIIETDVTQDECENPERGLLPYDAARAAVFLASPDADHISGQTIYIGGFEHIL